MERNSSAALVFAVSLLLVIPLGTAAGVRRTEVPISHRASSAPQASSAKDCSGLFGWRDACLLDRLRDPVYFGISPRDASDQQLLSYIKSNEQTIAALLLQVDYGRDLSRFLKGNNLLGSEKDFIDALSKATGVLDRLKQLANVLVALGESSGWTAVSESGRSLPRGKR